MLKLGSSTTQGRGLTYLPLWINITDRLQEIKLQNNLHSSSFPLLHLQETLQYKNFWLNQLIFTNFPFVYFISSFFYETEIPKVQDIASQVLHYLGMYGPALNLLPISFQSKALSCQVPGIVWLYYLDTVVI